MSDRTRSSETTPCARRPLPLPALLLLLLSPLSSTAQDRDTLVRNDLQSFAGSDFWIYNDLDAGRRRAFDTGKPMLVVFRCIPCEACHEFDESVAARDPVVRDLMDQFICVRIPQANSIDLSMFQFDFDQSFAVFLMHPDGTLYGRFGTRSGQDNEEEDISLEGLRAALGGALTMHANVEQLRPSLAGKQVVEARYERPRQYPSLAEQFGDRIDYEAENVARSCLHCHQIGEAERLAFRLDDQPVPDDVLFPYPHPKTLGLIMDPRARARVAAVEDGSAADRAGFVVDDEIITFDDQPLLSTADIQWVLHNAPDTTEIAAVVDRGSERKSLTVTLESGWRRKGDLSWRVTSWDLRRMGLGGMFLEDLATDERRRLGLPDETMALRARHVGEYGDHAVALHAGLRTGDVIVSYDGITDRRSESDLLAYALQQKRAGDEVEIAFLRDGVRRSVKIRLQ